MMSTQRIIILCLTMNMLLGIVTLIYSDTNADISEIIDTEISKSDERERDVESESGIFGVVKSTILRPVESSIGNPLKWGFNILGILLKAISPFSFGSATFSTPQEQMIARVIMFFRTILVTITIVEIYSYFKNRKVS